MTQMQNQLNKKHFCDPLFAGWFINPTHHRFNSSEVVSWVLDKPGQKLIRIEICKRISTQSNLNLRWVGLARMFQTNSSIK